MFVCLFVPSLVFPTYLLVASIGAWFKGQIFFIGALPLIPSLSHYSFQAVNTPQELLLSLPVSGRPRNSIPAGSCAYDYKCEKNSFKKGVVEVGTDRILTSTLSPNTTCKLTAPRSFPRPCCVGLSILRKYGAEKSLSLDLLKLKYTLHTHPPPFTSSLYVTYYIVTKNFALLFLHIKNLKAILL